MSVTKLQLKKATYLRAHDNEKTHNIILGGDSRWIRDIELLLEDQWKNLYCPEDYQAFGKTLADHPPRILVAEMGAYQSSETKLFDLNLPKGTEKLLVTHTLTDALAWKRAQRSLATRGVKCLELSPDAKLASEELSEVFTGLCASGFSLSEDLQLIQNAYQGYLVNDGNSHESDFLKLFKLLASKFVFDPNDIVAGILLAETYDLWKKPKDTASSLHFAYINAEHSVKDENIFKILQLAKKCADAYLTSGDLGETEFTQFSTESGFGRLTQRMIKGSYEEMKSTLSQNRRGLRVVKAA